MEGNSTKGHTLDDFTNCFEMADGYFHTRNIAMEIFMCAITVFTSVITVLENAVILISIRRNASLHTPSNVLLVNLALSDLAFGLVVQPVFIVGIFARIKRMGPVFCLVTLVCNAIGHWLCSVSLLTLTAISLERYLALYLHLRYREIVTVKRVIILVILVWMFGVLVGLTWLLHVQVCRVASLIIIFLCILLASFAYSKVYRIVRYHQMQIHATADLHETKARSLELVRFKRSTTSMFLVYILLVVCYVPYFGTLISLLSSGKLTSTLTSACDLASIVISINATVNPLVYCWRMRDIRDAVRETLRAVCYTRNVGQEEET